MPEQQSELLSIAPDGDALTADLPSAREVSNALFADTGSDTQTLSNLFWLWGQFIDHDMVRTASDVEDQFPITVPTGDPFFDPFGTGQATIEFSRSVKDGDGDVVNFTTPAIDGSHIYGSTDDVTALLRGDGGRLLISGDGMLPLGLQDNVAPQDAAGEGGHGPLFLAGDERAEENPGLLALHTLFVREHNRVVDELAAADPTLDDDALFDAARASVEATLVSITANEFLPQLVGTTISPVAGDDTISNEFATAAFRVGHTMLTATLEVMDATGATVSLSLRDAFFRPELIADGEALANVLRGAAQQTMNAVDLSLIDDVRNFLFGPPGAGGFDLGALNVQRGRDHELATYNDAREAFGLDRAQTFADISDDPHVQAALEQVYGSVDAVELFVGGLAEAPVAGGIVGETFATIIVEQFSRTLDGSGNGDTLADVIARNTEADWLQDDVMVAAARVFGTDADDLLASDSGGELIDGGAGRDIIIGSQAARGEQLRGGTEDDIIFGDHGEDTLLGDAGNDTLHAGGGDDAVLGGSGDDFLSGGDDDDFLDGGEGNDAFLGGNGNDVFVAGVGADVIHDFDIWTDRLALASDATAVQHFDTGTAIRTVEGDIWLIGIDMHDYTVIEFTEDEAVAA